MKIGTWLKYLIRPAVWAYDKIWGTDMLQCEVCAAREKAMNEAGSKFFAKVGNWSKKLLTRK